MRPASFSAIVMAGSRRPSLMYCHVLKAVHIGDPMRSAGHCSSSIRSALFRFSGREKSHGMPSSGSTTERSNAMPGAQAYLGRRAAKAPTRGGE